MQLVGLVKQIRKVRRLPGQIPRDIAGDGRDGRVRRGDHFVPRTDADAAERDVDGVRAVRDGDGLRRPEVLRELGFESRYLVAEHVATARENAEHRPIDGFAVGEVLSVRVTARNHTVCTRGT